jgi:hypothetical protein
MSNFNINIMSNNLYQTNSNFNLMRQTEILLRSTFNKTEMNPIGMKKKKAVMNKISG